ncbi:hypothetical protein [Pseudobacteriovorax antillogorgiicola]|uniref:Uncharacterized protein n=1 Tax=Pseudobacteriovorax antillogorgiicola TaxID=1513793 RepID=A0A1Y6BVB7_9BACT|nr:hypothetical protein [Pseudobacteriovorax antillogorgiicola]TCS53723.1 hypothetical protein EDD56_10732 [Pseudobacteriovorax antillogorgiicola]SMF22814.1 hypothetical protein SAMN06296036_107240 [Pseudobacteriovorax antillogorgiicola]
MKINMLMLLLISIVACQQQPLSPKRVTRTAGEAAPSKISDEELSELEDMDLPKETEDPEIIEVDWDGQTFKSIGSKYDLIPVN